MKKILQLLAVMFLPLSVLANPANIATNYSGTTVNDKALTLKSEEFVRQFSIDTNWTTIRLGLRLIATNNASSADSRFVIGLCSGTNGYFGSGSAPHFIGMNFLETFSGASLTNTGSVGATALMPGAAIAIGNGGAGMNTNNTIQLGKIVDGALTTATNGTIGSSLSANYGYIAGGSENGGSGTCNAIYMDFIKGSPWTVKVWMPSALYDNTSQELQDNMVRITPFDGNGSTMQNHYLTGQITVDEETDGYFDCLNILYSPTLYELRIHEVRISRIY